MSSPTLIIAGGGFCGVSLTAHLARLAWAGPVRIVLADRAPRVARGVAYSTMDPAHLLNVPAGRMGALAGDEGHFLAWLRAADPGIAGDAFVPRVRYGDYLEHLLADTIARAPAHVTIEVHRDDVTGAAHDGGRVYASLASGERIAGDALVLATGTLPPRNPPIADAAFFAQDCWVPDPWAPGALARIHTTLPVLFVGTGLTMIDALLTLSKSGHRAGFFAVSRHGMLPRTHRDWPAPPPVVDISAALDAWDGSAAALVRIVHRAAREANRGGMDWRDVINGLRPRTAALWQRMDEHERARFLRHARPYWDTHRHRMSTRVAAIVERMRERGDLDVVAGRIASCVRRGDRVDVAIALRRGGARRVEAGTVINCTGPESDYARVAEPLLRDLRDQGRLTPDALGLGILTDDAGALLDASGRASSWLFTLGSPRKPALWESTAVPELRTQAAALAQHLHARLS